jgi:hypothetical protein
MAERFVIQPFFEDLVASADERLVVKVWDMSDSPIFSPMLHVLVLITPKAFVRSSDDVLLPGDSAEINLHAPSIPPQDGLSWLKGNRRWSITDARARRLGQPIRQVPPAPERRWRRRRPLNQQLSFHPLLASMTGAGGQGTTRLSDVRRRKERRLTPSPSDPVGPRTSDHAAIRAIGACVYPPPEDRSQPEGPPVCEALEGGGAYGAALGVSQRWRRARSRLRGHRRGGIDVNDVDPAVLAARRPDAGAGRGGVLPRPLLRHNAHFVCLPAEPLVRMVRGQRPGPADRRATRPRRAVHPWPRRIGPTGLLNLHDDARRPRLLPLRPHRRPHCRRPSRLRPAPEGALR